jgi:hypothetical protein
MQGITGLGEELLASKQGLLNGFSARNESNKSADEEDLEISRKFCVCWVFELGNCRMQVMLRRANALVTLCFRVLSHYLHDPGAIPR